MRGYWLKILLGAVGVFAVGMLVVTAVRVVRSRVRSVAASSDPITLPLPFVPFRLDGERRGTFDRLVINRDTPHGVRSVDLHVNLGGTPGAERVHQCGGILAQLREGPGGQGHTLRDADFVCVRDDSVRANLEAFGEVHFLPDGHMAPLLVTPAVAARLRRELIQMRARHPGDSIAAQAESIAADAERRADSISTVAGRMADSITEYHERTADSIRRAALRRADSALRRQSKR